MDKIAETLNSFTPANWIAIAAILVAVLLWTATQYIAARRERSKTYEPTPLIKATINRKRYPDGWRSAQLHIVPGPDNQLFKYENWRIERANFLRPKDAIMARAENDDYATEVFYPENPIRTLQGKHEGRPQRFALEFFLKFPGDDLGRKAQFKVSFAHAQKRRKHSTKVWATVPDNAEVGEVQV
ncbi:MAG: hypothetical protein Q8L53_02355 [Aestuariivirga sp.]|nr:hypothetical protein [Aestuariivirga sp.]